MMEEDAELAKFANSTSRIPTEGVASYQISHS